MAKKGKGTYYRYSTEDGESSIFLMPKAAEWLARESFYPTDERGKPYIEFAESIEGVFPDDIISVPKAKDMVKERFPSYKYDRERVKRQVEDDDPDNAQLHKSDFEQYFIEPERVQSIESLEKGIAFYKSENQKLRNELARMKAKYES